MIVKHPSIQDVLGVVIVSIFSALHLRFRIIGASTVAMTRRPRACVQ